MKTGMGERAAQPVTLAVLAFFECHDQVKNPIRHRALAHSDDPSIRFAFRRAHCALVRVGGKELDQFPLRARKAEQFVNRFDANEVLIVAVSPGMVIRPRNGGGLRVIHGAARNVRILIARVEKMGRADSAKRADRRAGILVIACGEDAAAALPEGRDARTIPST
jgi:hypothetical protein